jgi:hypothetical protein
MTRFCIQSKTRQDSCQTGMVETIDGRRKCSYRIVNQMQWLVGGALLRLIGARGQPPERAIHILQEMQTKKAESQPHCA